MTTGSSLFLIAVFVVIVFLLYKMHQKKKWGLAIKIFSVVILFIAIIIASVFAYMWYVNRPHEVTVLGKVSLGMTPVEVTLALGKPTRDLSTETKKGYIYTNYSGDIEYLIRFKEGNGVSLVCSYNYTSDVFGLGVYDSESTVVNKLGAPSNVSINKDGLSKFISYEKYKVAFKIIKGGVEAVCVSESGRVSFTEEYNQDAI